mmetsp:Transcript_25628/g.73681  ORF Transcript_25628/g.73681 Transcript_25628/m.73681 type:complete len:313 (-) Transcript_25628:2-940(-)
MGRIFRLFGACAVACATEPGLDDCVALHQRLVVVPSLDSRSPDRGLLRPGSEERLKAQSVVGLVAGKGLDRVLQNMHLDVPEATKWKLLSSITQWAMERYSMPRSQAHLDLLNAIIDLYGKSFMTSGDDEQLLSELLDVPKIHAMARRFAEDTGALEATIKMIDAVHEAAVAEMSKQPEGNIIVLSSLPHIFDRTAARFRGQPLADTWLYASTVSQNKSAMDEAVLGGLLERVAEQLRLPPATANIVQEGIHQIRHHPTWDFNKVAGEVLRNLATPNIFLGGQDHSRPDSAWDFMKIAGEVMHSLARAPSCA